MARGWRTDVDEIEIEIGEMLPIGEVRYALQTRGTVVHRRDDPEPLGDALTPEEPGKVRLAGHPAQAEQGAPTR